MEIILTNSYSYDFDDQANNKHLTGTSRQVVVKNNGKLAIYKVSNDDQLKKAQELLNIELSNGSYYIDRIKNVLVLL